MHAPRPAVGRSLALLALLAACGVDQSASLGRFAPPELPIAGAQGAGVGGAPGQPPPVALDAGAPPAEPEPEPLPDAGDPMLPDVTPPRAGPCVEPRSYVGDFSCTLRFDASQSGPGPGSGGSPPPPGSGGPSPTMNTTLFFGLEPSADGSHARIVDGEFMFLAWDVAFMGRLEGRFDCPTGRFDAMIADGMTGAVFRDMPATFVGALQGRMVDADGNLEGSWWHGPSQDPMGGCMGTWTASPLP